MKSIKNNLSIFAVVVAAVSAFAFNGLDPEPDPTLKFFEKETTGGWIEVTTDYNCENSSDICVAQFEGDDPEFGQMLYRADGTFEAIPD